MRPPEPKMPKDAIIAAAQMGRFASHLYLIARSDTFKKEMMDALDVKQKYKVGASWLWATITATLHYTNGKIEQGIESLKSHVDPQSKLKGEGLTEVNCGPVLAICKSKSSKKRSCFLTEPYKVNRCESCPTIIKRKLC